MVGRLPPTPLLGARAPGALSIPIGATAMLEVRRATKGYVVYDTEACEPVMRFVSERAADEFVAEQQIMDLYGKLQHWHPEKVPAVY